jgi:ribonuclease J
MREGAQVIQSGKTHIHGVGPLHLSGHASYEEHVKMVNALNPTWYMPIHGEFHMLAHNAEMAEQKAAIPRKNILVCDSGDVVELDHDGDVKKTGRVPVGGIMFDDSGAEVSDVVVKDRLHMSNEGMFIAVLTIGRDGRLLTSPDIISRGFIYLRDSEELIGTIRQYLKQKIARSASGRKPEMETLKKEIKEDITHILYDQTRRTPIVIPVINEVSGGSSSPQQRNNNRPRPNNNGPNTNRPAPQNSQPKPPQNQHLKER